MSSRSEHSTGGVYDEIPYGNRTHAHTHPDRLFAIGTLFGMAPRDPFQARVLELGCASGGNLIPMAFHAPESSFVGVDLSPIQIDDGLKRIKDLSLENIELNQKSILDFEGELGEFDYIICHGVYSWVPDDVQRKILELCSTLLAPQGIAHVSFNTLPGWNLVKSVRDLMLYHVKPFDDRAEKASQARALLEFATAASEGAETAYSLLLRRELELLAQVDDAYLIHDHLGELNRPLYFHEFIAAAQSHGLQYLADSDLATMLPENLPDAIAAKLREIDDLARMEQYLDFLTGRRFRNALLCRGDVPLRRDLDTGCFRDLYVSAECVAESELEAHHLEDGVVVQFSMGKTTVRVAGRVGKVALRVLAAQRRHPLAYPELVERVASQAGIARDEVEDRIESELQLARLVFANAVELWPAPATYVSAIAERPRVTRLVRYQAGRGDSVTNERHELVELGPAERLILECLDGTRTKEDLAMTLIESLARRELTLSIDGEDAESDSVAEEAVRVYCQTVLEKLAEHALLV